MEQSIRQLGNQYLGITEEELIEVDIRGAEVVRRQFL